MIRSLVDVPRLYAVTPDDGPGHPGDFDAMRKALEGSL